MKSLFLKNGFVSSTPRYNFHIKSIEKKWNTLILNRLLLLFVFIEMGLASQHRFLLVFHDYYDFAMFFFLILFLNIV